MFKNIMASLGHGGAKVDLVLEKTEYQLGEMVEGKLVIQGGKVEQQINKIDVNFVASFYVKEHPYTQVVQSFPFHASFQIQPSEVREFPFSYLLPTNLLLSSHTVSYYFDTNLDIASAVDHKDKDYISIVPEARLQNVIFALEQLGFREQHDSRSFNGTVQEFEFTPTSFLSGQAEEIEFVAMIEPEGIRLLLEVDMYTFIGEKEIKREIWLDNGLLSDPSSLAYYLQQQIEEMVHNPHSFQGYHGGYFYPQAGHSSSGGGSGVGTAAVAAIGGFAAGVVAAGIIDHLTDDSDDDDDDDEEEVDDSFDDDDFDDFFGDDED
ncbi:sporulation protein [Hazenella coriacea]|uniref:Sporulation-control protein n=1 Tax=Hazenella coriacea TaxID=1179467 RepID=A0A4R3LAC8_9BACL|nr:sporulation protein [Hazenella coriacea]TCS96803.1 sporulation-control protein [Hazenella coriacea]